MKDTFNPYDWLDENEDDSQQPSNLSGFQKPDRFNDNDNIERVVSRIEATHTDITGSYADWRNLGFALSHELGEGGRSYFHRISRFYPKYSHTDCDKQYDHCLKAKGHGITIATLFYMAKELPGAAVFNRMSNRRTEDGDRRTEDGDGKPEDGDGRTEDGDGKPETEERKPEDGDGKPENEERRTEDGDGGTENAERDMEQDAVENGSACLVEMPTFPDSIYAGLPEFLKKVVVPCLTDEERDIMLIGALVTVSCCFPKVYGIYDRKRVYPNLFLYITSKASAGKGLLVFCKQLGKPIHWEQLKLFHAMKVHYEAEMREYNLMKMKDFNLEKPIKPPEKMLFLPANNSATGVFQLLADNEGKGLIFETEGDTLAQIFKTDYGNYSDGFRKAFHHETISYYRRTDREYVEIDEPCLSAVLSGTPKQISALIPNAENGLFSRFIFYYMNMKVKWNDVLEDNDEDGLHGYYNELGQELLTLYNALNKNPAIKFSVSPEQHIQFNAFFSQLQDKYLMLQGIDYLATVRRLGLISYRIAMIFTFLRILESGDFSQRQVCSDTDFQAALSMVRVLVRHASHVYSELPVEVTPFRQKNKQEMFLEGLPEKFTHQDIVTLSKRLAIHIRTAERYIIQFCGKGWVLKDCHGNYTNTILTGKGNEPTLDK